MAIQAAATTAARCRVSSRPQPSVRQYYHTLLWRLLSSKPEPPSDFQIMAITSCQRGEGVSTVATHLALAAAADGLRVLLVDANLANPSLHRMFGVVPRPGLSEALVDAEAVPTCVQSSGTPNLSLLTAGAHADGAQLLFHRRRFEELMQTLRVDFDLVLVDMPPAEKSNPTADTVGMTDGVLLVIESERVRWEVALRTRELLERAGGNLLGVVLNKRHEYLPRWLGRMI